MNIQPVFLATEITSIGNNVAGTVIAGSQPAPTQGAKRYRVLNMTGAPLFVRDELGQYINVVAGMSNAEYPLYTPTRTLTLVYDPAYGYNSPGSPYAINPSWQAWIYPIYEWRRTGTETAV